MTPRRDFLTLAASVPAVRPVAAADHPDANVIAAGAMVEHLSVAYARTCAIPDDDARDAAQCRLDDAMVAPLATVCRVPAGTLVGLRAKARALAAWDEDAFQVNDDPDDRADERLRASLIRDLLAVRP